MNTIANNKLIAEFLGAEFHYYTSNPDEAKFKNSKSKKEWVWGSEAKIFESCGHWWRCSFTPKDHFSWYFPNDLKYHKSWAWLMPTACKIANLRDNEGRYLYAMSNSKEYFEGPMLFAFASSMKKVYKEIVRFIQWYNKQKISTI